PNARIGQWVSGPGAELFGAARRELGTLLAEDLGIITPDVVALRGQFQIPGTRVSANHVGFGVFAPLTRLARTCPVVLIETGVGAAPTHYWGRLLNTFAC